VIAKISDLVGIINKIAPPRLAEEWDNVGLQVGDPTAPVERILVALDPTPAAIRAAIESSCQLLLTHHPLIFKPLKKISAADPTSSLIFQAIRHELAVFSLHTNYDIAAEGLNDLLAARLGVEETRPLKVTSVDDLVKLAVFVPLGHEEAVMNALFRFTSDIGAYDECSFRGEGIGTFRPLPGARPFIGKVGTRESVAESRLELLLRKADLAAAVKALCAAHPYEEPAFDCYPLLNQGETLGLGRIGRLGETVTLGGFASIVKERLQTNTLRLVGSPDRPVRKVALCSGSGASLLREAVRQGADVLVTGDIKYHEARDAEALGVALVDAGHFATERIMAEAVADRLRGALATSPYDLIVAPFTDDNDPFTAW
jgi:dinuclear metal center YbgI/SA1388 family protein